jgi:hypothetical protein
VIEAGAILDALFDGVALNDNNEWLDEPNPWDDAGQAS